MIGARPFLRGSAIVWSAAVWTAIVTLAGIALGTAPAALAEGTSSSFENGLANVAWAEHPGAAIAAIASIVLASLATAAGLGCAIALIGAVVPRVRDAVDAAVRPAPAGRLLLVGSLTLGGTLFALMGANRTGVPAVSMTVFLLLGVPSLVLLLVGALGAVPLLGERLLGSKGHDASPIRRSVTATLTMGAALLPSFALNCPAFGVLIGLVALAWPLGAGIQAARRLFARRT